MKIGLLSDTHSYLDDTIFKHFAQCDEVWHAGDIGDSKLLETMESFKPTRAVFGNIDSPDLQRRLPEDFWFTCEGLNILITHIGGVPPNYNARIKKVFSLNIPDIFICGHSHILRVLRDPQRENMLYLNPGAAGNHGFHHIKTVMRFEITNKIIKNMEVVELGKRGAIL